MFFATMSKPLKVLCLLFMISMFTFGIVSIISEGAVSQAVGPLIFAGVFDILFIVDLVLTIIDLFRKK